MFKRIRKKTQPIVEFRESNGTACGAVCRGNELIDSKRNRALLSGWKQA